MSNFEKDLGAIQVSHEHNDHIATDCNGSNPEIRSSKLDTYIYTSNFRCFKLGLDPTIFEQELCEFGD